MEKDEVPTQLRHNVMVKYIYMKEKMTKETKESVNYS